MSADKAASESKLLYDDDSALDWRTKRRSQDSRSALRRRAALVLACVVLTLCFWSPRRWFSSSGPDDETKESKPKLWGKHTAAESAWVQRARLRAYADAHAEAAPSNKIEERFLGMPDPESARTASHAYTAKPHVAGTDGDKDVALLIKSQWEKLLGADVSEPEEHVYDAGTRESRALLTGHPLNGKATPLAGSRGGATKRNWALDASLKTAPRVWTDTYYSLLSYGRNSSLTLSSGGEVEFSAKLKEDLVAEDEGSQKGREQVPSFHGFGKDGEAEAQLVYASYGRKQDFDDLQAQGVDFTGKIVIVKYGGVFRGLKVKAAAEAGAVACIIYSDPQDDGEMVETNGYKPYPDGPARHPSSVQRGSAQFLSIYPGDPLTPLYPAYKKTAHRLPRDDPSINIPSIPSLPISYEDAVPLLRSLNGRGLKLGSADKPEGGLGHMGVDYFTGPSDKVVKLVNRMDERITPIWNTMAVIPGHIDEVVYVGNHHDAWTEGAADPNSGTAAVHEVVKGFGKLLRQGWRPLRTIVFAAWDAEEYGLISSTEHCEDYRDWIKSHVAAYLNIDVGNAGSQFHIAATPSLAQMYKDVAALVEDPDAPDTSLLDKLVVQATSLEGNVHAAALGEDMTIGALGSGSDFSGFVQHVGVAGSDVGYAPSKKDPVYMYHSIFDSAYWQDHFGDPTFARHTAVAKVLGLAALRMSTSLILPLNVSAYAHELENYVVKFKNISSTILSADELAGLKLDKLDKAVANVQAAASALDDEIDDARAALDDVLIDRGTSGQVYARVRSINERLQSFEGGFIDTRGLVGREWYRSLVVAPGRNLGYGATTLPGLTESITLDRDVRRARFEVDRLVASFAGLAQMLRPPSLITG